MHVQYRNSSVPCTCKKVSYYENHWGTTGMPEIILIHTCTLCILLGFSSQKGKAKKTNFQTFSAIKRVRLFKV